MPTVRSICHGGIWREATRCLMDFAQGRVSSYDTRDIGAMEFLRWQSWHFSWKIGTMSLWKVTAFAAVVSAANRDVEKAIAPRAMYWNVLIPCSLPGIRVDLLDGGQL